MKTFPYLIPFAVVFCIPLFFSCTPDIEPLSPPEQGKLSSSSVNESVKYCVYQEVQQCIQTSQTKCPAGGELSDFCPPFFTPSSSSSKYGQSSSTVLEYNYCVFDAEKTCLSGKMTICPSGGALSNKCPYSSSSSMQTRSSSSSASSSSNDIASSSSYSSIGTVSSSSNKCPSVSANDVFVDSRDCKIYKIETDLNGKIWMSENLNYSRNNTLGYCYNTDINGVDPHKDASGCDNSYGRVYEWAVAMDNNSPQGLCPNGWHIPSVDEWASITDNPKYCGHINMSNNFCISAGNYDHLKGWKEKDYSGFYWTSSGYSSFTGLWHCSPTSNPTANGCMDVQAGDVSNEYFSIRCLQD
ncbi:MAG: fibrobacter succinogenes major paralogous domain-containing protein [Fibromonadaceae bacterium]|jgi:uncharacterized protein (TIGR02145 family)|nr:fibrobacter succinogenes major paralogous domain-containing protein [Fibromonadaceae bacterium]